MAPPATLPRGAPPARRGFTALGGPPCPPYSPPPLLGDTSLPPPPPPPPPCSARLGPIAPLAPLTLPPKKTASPGTCAQRIPQGNTSPPLPARKRRGQMPAPSLKVIAVCVLLPRDHTAQLDLLSLVCSVLKAHFAKGARSLLSHALQLLRVATALKALL